MDTLYVGNDHILEIKELRDADGQPVVGANVTATLLEADGVTEVTGVAWPLTLPYVGQVGRYRAVLEPTVDVEAGGRYVLRVRAEYAGAVYTVDRTVLVRWRTS